MNRQPYIGLRAFSREEQSLFFGREQHSNELIERLNSQHFLAVVGDSGCGKSSLIKAGLIPGLQAGFLTDAGSHWRIAETRPGNAPFANLAQALCQETALGKDYEIALKKNQFLTRSPFNLHELLAIKPLPNNAKLLIVCDQFEELFRYSKQQTNTEEAAAFAALLLASANPYPLASGEISNSVYVILTMRSDYLGNCAQFAGLAEAINQGLYLTPRLNRQQLRAAIERPALVCNGKVEPALLGRLLNEAGNDVDQLPLLQHVLMRLWDKAKQANFKEDCHTDNNSNVMPVGDGHPVPGMAEEIMTDTSLCLDSGNPCRNDEFKLQPIIITLADYEDESIQTLKNALSTHADEAFNELTDTQQRIAQQIFCRLTGAETGKADTRNPTKVADLIALTGQSLEQLAAVLKPFRQAGRCFLLPSEEVELKDEIVIDITHESLIRNWERLDNWTKEEAESAAIYKRLEQNALLHYRREHGFYRTPELEATLKWYQEQQPSADWAKRYGKRFRLAIAFLQRSLHEQQAYQEKQRLAQQQEIEKQKAEQQREKDQAKSKQRFLLSGLIIATGLSIWAWQERNHAELQSELAQQQSIRAEKSEQQRVKELFESRITHASLLAKGEDYAGAKQVLKETDALDKQVSPSLRHARNLLASFTEIKGGEAQQVYRGAGYALFTVAISPDGKLLAAGGEHGTLVLFDVQSGKLLQRLEGHITEEAGDELSIYSIAFTPSGQLISAGADKKIIIWQRQTATNPTDELFKKQRELLAPAVVNAIALSPDGKLLASGGNDNNITLWELSSGKKLHTLSQHRESITNLTFSPDRRYLASSSYDDSAIIWQLADNKPKPLHVLTGHTANVYSTSFSPDSATLVTSSSDKTLRLWDVATGEQQRVLNGHQNMVFAVSWFGDYLVSGSFDRSIRLWDSRSGVSLWLWQGHESGVQAFALYGGSLWSASNDGTVRRWSLSLPFQQARALPSEPFSSVITPALNQVAVGFRNGDLSVYALSQSEPIWHKSAVHNDRITRLTVSRDGRLLASSSLDNTAKLWQINPPSNPPFVKGGRGGFPTFTKRGRGNFFICTTNF